MLRFGLGKSTDETCLTWESPVHAAYRSAAIICAFARRPPLAVSVIAFALSASCRAMYAPHGDERVSAGRSRVKASDRHADLQEARLSRLRDPALPRARSRRPGELGLEGRAQHHDHGLAHG